MKLIFEKSVPGRRCTILPPCDVDTVALPEELCRAEKPALPELSETDISRHYTELVKQVHGVNCGFYPLGSCTMKYNPRQPCLASPTPIPWLLRKPRRVRWRCWTPPRATCAKSPAWTT